MLTKETAGEYITVMPDGSLEYKRVERIFDSGTQVAETNWRTTYEPSNDMSDLSPRTAEIAATVWTTDVIEAYAAAKEAANEELLP